MRINIGDLLTYTSDRHLIAIYEGKKNAYHHLRFLRTEYGAIGHSSLTYSGLGEMFDSWEKLY